MQIKYTAKLSRCRFRPTKCRYFPDTVSLKLRASVATAPIYAVLGKGTAPFDTSIINHGLSHNLYFEHMTRNYTILCFDTNKRSLQIHLILRICRERLLNLLFHHPIIFLFGSSSIMNKGYKGKLGVINFPYR